MKSEYELVVLKPKKTNEPLDYVWLKITKISKVASDQMLNFVGLGKLKMPEKKFEIDTFLNNFAYGAVGDTKNKIIKEITDQAPNGVPLITHTDDKIKTHFNKDHKKWLQKKYNLTDKKTFTIHLAGHFSEHFEFIPVSSLAEVTRLPKLPRIFPIPSNIKSDFDRLVNVALTQWLALLQGEKGLIARFLSEFEENSEEPARALMNYMQVIDHVFSGEQQIALRAEIKTFLVDICSLIQGQVPGSWKLGPISYRSVKQQFIIACKAFLQDKPQVQETVSLTQDNSNNAEVSNNNNNNSETTEENHGQKRKLSDTEETSDREGVAELLIQFSNILHGNSVNNNAINLSVATQSGTEVFKAPEMPGPG